MCIVALAWQVLDDIPICLISNRDEFYQRPTQVVHAWPNSPIVAGRDLQSGGTWLGVTASGRWAVITNFREGQNKTLYTTSRGAIVEQFLASELTPIRFAQQLEKQQCDYAGFNILIGDQSQAVYMSNRGEPPQVLAKGVYVLSNGLMSEYWEKTQHLRKRFTQEFLPLLQHQQIPEKDLQYAVWDILEDERKLDSTQLPNTGIPLELEQLLSSTFIQSEDYGTRSSNFICMQNKAWHWIEKNHMSYIEKGQHVQTSDLIQHHKIPLKP